MAISEKFGPSTLNTLLEGAKTRGLTEELVRQEMAALGDKLEIREIADSSDLLDGPANDDKAVAAWCRNFSISPLELSGRLLKGLPTDAKLWIEFFPEGQSKEASLTLCTFDSDAPLESRQTHGSWNNIPGRAMRLVRVFDFDTHTMYAGGARIYNPANRGQGLVRPTIENFIDLAQSLGMERVSTKPAEMGAYTWAKYGFLPTKESWNNLRPQLAFRFQCIIADDRFAGQFDYKEVKEIEALLESDNPRSLWRLADMKTDIAGQSLGKRLLFPKFEELIPQYAADLSEDKRELEWKGGLEFKNNEQMQRYHSYLASKKQSPNPTFKPASAPTLV